MCDGWEKKYGCLCQIVADLPGYQRKFNKKSVENWGTKQKPCPTLNIVKPTLNVEKSDSVTCRGVAFEFSDHKQEEILAYLRKREGKSCELPKLSICLDVGQEVSAYVPVYVGKNLVFSDSIGDRVHMIRIAKGTSGNCIDYVECIAKKLSELGINDPEVSQFWDALRNH